MEMANGLHRVGSDIVNSYLIVDNDGVTIIDAGLPGYWKLLLEELDAIGTSLDDVRALVLTHGDSDHIGFAARLHRETGIAAHVHEADVDRARLKVKKANSGWVRSRSARWPASCGIPLVAAACGSGRRRRYARSRTTTFSMCQVRHGSFTRPDTRPAASWCTSRPSTRCSSATR